jgi:SAM-dependent methyltransferase
VVALDYAADEMTGTRNTFAAMAEAGEIQPERFVGVLRGDATGLPFPSGTFARIVASEVLEHIQDDVTAIAELTRVLAPGGMLAVTVPAWLPEKINWMLSDEYHAPKAKGGHVRIYSVTELAAKLRAAGLDVVARHRAHGLHTPYWWLRCAVGVNNEEHWAVARYRRFLEGTIVAPPCWLPVVERIVDPLLGKSSVLYGRKPA